MAEILVVEDDPMLGRLWQRAIAGAGHRVRLVTSVGTARRALMVQQADVILLDLNLGAESGLGLVTLASYVNPEVRILIATGSALFPRGELFALSPSIAAVLRKPISVEEILALIDHHGPAVGAPGAVARGSNITALSA